jgi:hypothetical protein
MIKAPSRSETTTLTTCSITHNGDGNVVASSSTVDFEIGGFPRKSGHESSANYM